MSDSYHDTIATVITQGIDRAGYVVIPRDWLASLLRLHDELAEMTCVAPSMDAVAMLEKLRDVAAGGKERG
jgi:hypothetical protein